MKQRKHRGRVADEPSLNSIKHLLSAESDPHYAKDRLIEYLHQVQDAFHCLSDKHLVALAHLLKLSVVEVYEVASFYHHFDVVKKGERPPPALTIRVCNSLSCKMAGADKLVVNLEDALAPHIRIQPVPCVGRCDSAPVAVVGTKPVANATSTIITELIQAHTIHDTAPKNARGLKPYIADKGYQLFQQLIDKKKPVEDIFKALEKSGLRGLGGAGFPVGQKWRIVHEQPSPRLMAVNIDEGEPGTFKDRHYLERDPHRFLEGMLIAAHCVGIDKIFIYLRDEYAGIRELLTHELALLQQHFTNIPAIELRRGAGAYICGEESAMIESIEGKRGMPRLRPPFVAQVGLFNHPTLEHNMESLYWVRDIIEKGADWFTSQGRHGRKGLRSFSVSGRVKKAGVYLAPAGITLQELIDEYCEGMQDGHQLYGYFPGGASGGILPATMANIPLDFDTLHEHGCFIGSAAIIVFSMADSARNLALNAMQFFQHESCGQCTPCRVGTAKAVKLMNQESWDRDLIQDLSSVMRDASICGLGQAAPNPMECVIKYFPHEIRGGEA